jgi:PAS domain S-box-containing protein
MAGQWLALIQGHGASIFLANGLYVALLLSSPSRDWPRWAATVCLVEGVVELTLYHSGLAPAIFDALGHALGAFAGAHLVRACRGLPFQLRTMRDVLALSCATALIAPAIGMLFCLLSATGAGRATDGQYWLSYWMGDAAGALVVAPLLLSLRQDAGHFRELRAALGAKWLEGAALLVILVTILHFIFSSNLPTVYFSLPMLVWAAARFGMTGVSVVMAVFMVVIVRYSALGLGPYGGSLLGRTLLAQSFLAVTAICALCLAAIFVQYQAAQLALRRARDKLEQRVAERTAALADSEQRLRDSNALFAIARGAAKMIILEWVVATDTLTFSDDPAWLRGPLPESGQYPLFRDQVLAEDRARFLDMRQRALDSLHGGTFEFRLVRTDGIVLWVQTYQSVFAGLDGKAVRVVAAIQDISARKQSEALLQESEQRLRALLDGIPERAWLKDAEGRYIALNRAHAKAYDLPTAKVIGKTIFDLRPAEVAERVAAEDRMAMANGAPMRFERHSFMLGNWVEITRAPVYSADGRNAGLVGIWRDITVRKQAEQQVLADSEQRYRTLVNATSQSVWVLDADGTLASVMKSLMGETVDNVRERHLLDFVHPEDRADAAAVMQAAVAAKSAYEHEHRVMDKNGRVWDVITRAVPVLNAEGSVREWIGTSMDVSAQKAAERALRQSNQTLRMLSGRREAVLEEERARIAHNLHDGAAQSLNVVRLKIAALARETADGARAAALRELLTLIDQVNQEIRSLEFELSPPVLRQLGLIPALQWLSEEMQRSYGLRVTTSDDGEDKSLDQAHRASSFRAVRELLINAAKHAKVSAAHVDTQRVDNTIVITVSDMGAGFDAANAEKTGVLGLGLAIVRERIEFSGGQVKFNSTPGVGTASTIVMPLNFPEKTLKVEAEWL